VIHGECVRCGFTGEYSSPGECREIMLAHSRAVHPNPLPSWFEDDGEIVTRHGMAALNGHDRSFSHG
jgi:hypothetical protein